ncbi:beta-glucosidase [Vibrio palustris]|uniref:Thermostable beta-glucosidase B n=1 Tax=Vibrio palustris TaxID=1918946 RepID=A0A1R4B0V1_9VIBR|nr:glycoside hydrolase family 3 C-terminal domain-containing protein [Vibrio palustris]SJL82542.1 Thermostable beta-glucosidase B [Vibrio palustris]
MKTQKTILATLLPLVLLQGCKQSSTDNIEAPKTYKEQAEALVAKMTPYEQVSILVGPGFAPGPEGFSVNYSALNNLKSDVPGTVGYINGVHNTESGLDIGAVKLADGAAGVRIEPTRAGDNNTYYGTAFPVSTLLASTWNPELVELVGKTIANEVKEYGLDFWLAPGLNIQRNPLNGRNFEYFSEDPFLSGVMASAEVKGAQSEGVGTTIKHFVANNAETSRNIVDNIISPRALREIYMRGFEYAVKNASPWAVMTAMNQVNGHFSGQWKDLNTIVLRDEWGFKGMVMSDWWSGDGNYPEMIKSGNDLIESGGKAWAYRPNEVGALDQLNAAYESGDLDSSTIKNSAVRVLTQSLKTPTNQGYEFSNSPDLHAHASISRAAASEGIILLKNTANTLPIDSSLSVASFGINQINTFKGGYGSGDVNAAYTINIADGLSKQFILDTDLKKRYEMFFFENKSETDFQGLSTIVECAEPPLTSNEIESYINSNDIAVISIGRTSIQGTDRTNTPGDYQLSTDERELINNVSAAAHKNDKKVVVVLNVAGIINMDSWQDKVDAVVLAYMPGQEAGNVIADVLSGKVNPSGKLTQTIPVSYTDLPSAANFPGTDTDSDGKVDTHYYNEGIYVGYRYFDTFNKPVSYPFGYGLSYTDFEYSSALMVQNTLNTKQSLGKVTFSVDVTNIGKVAGKNVAQVYIAAPAGRLKKPAIELKAFAKTKQLEPATRQKLTFNIPAKWLASFDATRNQWIIEPGVYKAYISQSSDVDGVDPVTFTVNNELVVSKTTAGALALPGSMIASDFETDFH